MTRVSGHREANATVNRSPWLGVAVWAWRGVWAVAGRAGIWVPFLIVSAVQAGVLLLMTGFHHPVLLPLGLPLIRLMVGDGAAHYPTLLYVLPTLFFRANLLIEVLVASLAGGVATVLFARAFGSREATEQSPRILRRAPSLMLVSLLIVAVLLGITALTARVPRELVVRERMVRWGMLIGEMGLIVVIQSFMAYTTAFIVLKGHGIWPALRDSVRVTWRTFLPTLVAVGLPQLLIFPFSFATSRVGLVADRLKPEVVTGLIGVQIVVQLLAAFLLVGAVTRLFLWRLEPEESR